MSSDHPEAALAYHHRRPPGKLAVTPTKPCLTRHDLARALAALTKEAVPDAVAGGKVIGPILGGMRKPVHILQRGAEVKDSVNLAALAVVAAQQQRAAR